MSARWRHRGHKERLLLTLLHNGLIEDGDIGCLDILAAVLLEGREAVTDASRENQIR